MRSRRGGRRRKLRIESLENRHLLAVVINELHYNADDNTSFEEFVELHNTAATAVDISGWSFTDGIDFTFAQGQTIPAGGYLVVAQDPDTLLSQFGAVAVGTYSGGLSNGGERIALSDELGNLIDEVEYGTELPWPIAPDGEGVSMELINPQLDNNLGSNWRPAYTAPLFGEGSEDPPATSGSLNDLLHRWSFSGDLVDSVGGASGVLVDPTGLADFHSGQLDVSANSGQSSDQGPVFQSGAYVDLPNGIISDLGESATFEWWGTVTRNREWAEIFSFGRSQGGEDQSTGANNQSYITLIPRSGADTVRLTHRQGSSGNESWVDWTEDADTHVELHFAVTWDGANNTQTLYVNGQSAGSSLTLIDLDDLDDVNNWLGRSQFGDALFDGRHNEFRIYSRALTSGEVASSYTAGADAVIAGPTIGSFVADASDVVPGQSVTLAWNVQEADTLVITPDVGNVLGQSQVMVAPTTSTTYTITATNEQGTATRSLFVSVNAPRATPGAPNNVLADNAAPAITDVQSSGGETSSSTGVITAEVSDPDGVASVDLQYQIVLPGEYIPATLPVPHNELLANPELLPTANPEYFDLANWATIAMVDDGTGADQVAGDGIYTAAVPAQAHRTLVRYRIEVADTLGASSLAPYADDASLNFAYFVYDGVPEYQNNSGDVLANADDLASLPVYHLLTRSDDLSEAVAYDGGDQIAQGTEARFTWNWAGTMVYNGQVYDNIHYRLRGANGRYYGDGKRSMRFRFNDGNWFEPTDQQGNPYPEKWKTLTTGKGFDNHETLTYALNEAMTMQLYNMMGLPAIETHWFQFRVIDNAAEAPDQWNGDFWGINFALEDYDKRFLDAHGLEEGNLYKLINQSQDALRQQDYQAPNAVTDGSDHDYIEYVLSRSSTDIEYRVNLEKYYIYHAVSEAVRHYDYWPDANKNMAYYFEPDYLAENDYLGKLWILPWDTDATWGPTWNQGEDVVYDALFENNDPQYRYELILPEFYNTLRELRDLIWQPDQLEGMITELASNLLPLEAADRARWQGAPDEAGNYDGLGGAGIVSIDNLVEDMLNFAFVGGNWPSGGTASSGTVGPGGRAAYLDSLLAATGEEGRIPQTPTLSYVGDPNIWAGGLQFQTTSFVDPQGDNFAAVQWRISEVTDASAGLDPDTLFLDEWTASWDSGAITSYSESIAPPASAVTAGATHRARVRFQDDTGRWSHWSEPVEFAVGESDSLPTLAITELHYHPYNPGLVDEDDQEFIEIKNTGSEPVDLSGVQIADFASEAYVFASGQTLAPGDYIIVARDVATFESVYGTDLNVALGGFGDRNLSNGGERITLLDANGLLIQSFEYSDDAPWPTSPDGQGQSLEIVDPLGDASDPANWRASLYWGGSPGNEGYPLPGDYDANGLVDQADYQVWKAAFGSSVATVGFGADGNRDGEISLADFIVWRNHLGLTALQPSQPLSTLAAEHQDVTPNQSQTATVSTASSYPFSGTSPTAAGNSTQDESSPTALEQAIEELYEPAEAELPLLPEADEPQEVQVFMDSAGATRSTDDEASLADAALGIDWGLES
ncbi:lamin tail domain-containing protein [Aeoliella sp. ICT_H6.2]|uniref:Lamin tail domain-containing protein n=1 Tax=Aeoliella straminimaris TaxID=2954799 RepID=A0A9X2JIT5_9BACT|nr:lamin tail domain-containing protein [Aeoliella straminimaris]MCO6046872.1 lamin tail domain-containing protein [Aeoliella straminimaris]